VAKVKRAFQDETLFHPIYKKLYDRTMLGRPGDSKEEPIKYTQSLHDSLYYDIIAEWIARLNENASAGDKFMKGEIARDEEIKKMDKYMQEAGVDDMVESLESGDAEAMEAVDQAEGLLDSTGMEMIEDLLQSGRSFTDYGMWPPVIVLPISMSYAVDVILYGPSTTVSYSTLDCWTMENLPYLEAWHIEEGVQKARSSFMWENAEEILERRHMRTGERFKYIPVNRPLGEGGMVMIDILKDIRNDQFPEYATAPFYYHGHVSNVGLQAQYCSRSMLELMGTLLKVYFSTTMGKFPYRSYNFFCPSPGLFTMLQDLPVDMIAPRFIGILGGANFWWTNYILTHHTTLLEGFGEEMIPPTGEESMGAYLVYGMDKFRYPTTYKQSKYVYGEEARMISPTDYPLPVKETVSAGDAHDTILKARKEHPEWLTGY